MSISPSDSARPLSAAYYDGKTAAAHQVELSLYGNILRLSGADIEVYWPLEEVHISERLGKTPRLLNYTGGGHCEVTAHDALNEMLFNAMLSNPELSRRISQPSMMDNLQHGLHWALLAAVLIVLTLLGIYRYLLPWGAEVIAMRLPDAVQQNISGSTLETLDHIMLKPSKLDRARQQKISTEFAKLKLPSDSQSNYQIVFRSSQEMGPNAFALPDGTIVMLDELLALTQDDNEILAVLAHERGHVERRHALRMLLQSSAVGLVLTWYLGDISTLLATAPAILMQAKYSRDMESEADKYAEQTLTLNRLSPCLLATLLQKLESAHKLNTAQSDESKNQILDYLTSHPPTEERSNSLCPNVPTSN